MAGRRRLRRGGTARAAADRRGFAHHTNYYTSTHSKSPFRRTLTIQRVTPDEHVILRPTIVTRYRNGVRTDTPIDPSQVRFYARELFGVDLGEAPLLFESQEL